MTNDTQPKQVVVEVKPWYESRTLWINGLSVVAAILAFIVDTQTTGGLPFELDPRWVLFVLGVVNLLLRMMTSQPVTRSGSR